MVTCYQVTGTLHGDYSQLFTHMTTMHHTFTAQFDHQLGWYVRVWVEKILHHWALLMANPVLSRSRAPSLNCRHCNDRST